MLVPLRGPIHDEHGRRSRHRVDDTDEGLLRNTSAMCPAHGEEPGARQREDERVPVRRVALDRVAREEGDGDPEGRRLGERQVHEDDATREHVEPEVDVDRGEHEAGEEREREELDHGPSASTRRRTSSSKRAT